MLPAFTVIQNETILVKRVFYAVIILFRSDRCSSQIFTSAITTLTARHILVTKQI